MRIQVTYANVRPGDVLIDCVGRPYFKVESVHQARARYYLVFFGASLQHRDGARSAGGHKDNVVIVERRGEA